MLPYEILGFDRICFSCSKINSTNLGSHLSENTRNSDNENNDNIREKHTSEYIMHLLTLGAQM